MSTEGSESVQEPNSTPECCMCGDCGISCELFQCTTCKFRSQHRYCSNLYPRAESYEVCNWCLRTTGEDTKERSHTSSHSSSSSKSTLDDKKKAHNSSLGQRNPPSLSQSRAKKTQPNLENHAPLRRRIITRGRLEEMRLLRANSERNSPAVGNRHVFRSKVRRYKLLDEVSS